MYCVNNVTDHLYSTDCLPVVFLDACFSYAVKKETIFVATVVTGGHQLIVLGCSVVCLVWRMRRTGQLSVFSSGER